MKFFLVNIVFFIATTFLVFSQNSNLEQIKAQSDSLSTSSNASEETIEYYAQDSMIIDLSKKTMILRGNSSIKKDKLEIEASKIDIDNENKLLDATFSKDSLGNFEGFPTIKESGQDYTVEGFSYNFNTQKGILQKGETKLSEGFYFGNVIKKHLTVRFLSKMVYYTTCDDIDPHYYFGSSKMKIINGEKVFLDLSFFM